MLLLGILAMPLLLFTFTLVCISIWINDRGPIFYKQIRLGKNGKPFKLYKFRTMVIDAEKQLGLYGHLHMIIELPESVK